MKRLFCVIASLLLSACTFARGLPSAAPTVHNEIPAGSVKADDAEVQKYLRITTQFSRYHYPWVAFPQVYIVPEAAWIEEVGDGFLGVTLYAEPHYVLIRESMLTTPDEFHATLVHELTHWLQTQSGWNAHATCFDQVGHEVEAYAVEHTFELLYQHRETNFHMPDYVCFPERGHHDDSPVGVIGPPIITKPE